MRPSPRYASVRSWLRSSGVHGIYLSLPFAEEFVCGKGEVVGVEGVAEDIIHTYFYLHVQILEKTRN